LPGAQDRPDSLQSPRLTQHHCRFAEHPRRPAAETVPRMFFGCMALQPGSRISEQRSKLLEMFPARRDSRVACRKFPPEADPMHEISSGIRRTETLDGAVLLDVHHGQMFCLNVVGAKILELMRQGREETYIAEVISRDYGADRETVRADVREFIAALTRHHILQAPRPAAL